MHYAGIMKPHQYNPVSPPKLVHFGFSQMLSLLLEAHLNVVYRISSVTDSDL